MSHASPTRRILRDLPVNTAVAPFAMATGGKDMTGTKRCITEVEDPEPSSAATRVRAAPISSQQRPRALPLTQSGPQDAVDVSDCRTRSLGATDPPEEGDDIGSQPSNKGSVISLTDSDGEDGTTASQQTNATELTQPVRSLASLRAENLRLRLRVALFKVQTNQTNIPMSRLQISHRDSHTSPPSPQTLPQTSLQSSPESPKRMSVLRLLPAPILQPTAYSARNVVQHQIRSSQPVLSSPPSSANNSPGTKDDVFRTPALPPSRLQETALQTSSPPDSQQGDAGEQEDGSTSSAVRGKAAIGLLGLMRSNRSQ